MPFQISSFALAAYVGPLVTAALSDFRSFRIPNGSVASLIILYPFAALVAGHRAEVPSHILVGLGMLLAGLPLFTYRVMGGGDVKLMSAACMWLGYMKLPAFLFLTTIIGGIFAIAVLVARHFCHSRVDRIPYGVPIAFAALLLAPTVVWG